MNIELILLCVIGVIFLLDFILNSIKKKSVSNTVVELMNTEGNSNNKKKIFIRIFLFAALSITVYFLLNQKDSKFINIAEPLTPIEDVRNKLSALGENSCEEVYFTEINSLFEKYYDCLECVEKISYFHSGCLLDDEYARHKIRHFARAIELGSSDLEILVQDMRYKDFAGDNYGAKERSKQIQMIIESLDEGDLKRYYHSVGNYYLFQADIYDWKYSIVNSYHLIAIQYYEKALEAVSQENPLVIKDKAIRIADKMIYYHRSFANRYEGKYYWWYNFPGKDRKDICGFMSRLGSLGAEEMYEVMKDLCSN
jgi:hypothetical protein